MSVPVAAAVSAGVLAIGLAGVLATGLLVAGAQAAHAADAAALAAADAEFSMVLNGVAEPCDLAELVARANGAALVSCEQSEAPGEVRVQVVARVGLMSVTRSARAGPPSVG